MTGEGTGAAAAGREESVLARLRHYFLLGLVSVAPLAITAWVLLWFYRLVDNFVRPWLQRIAALREVPGFFLTLAGFLVFLILVTLIGLGARNIIGITFFGMTERWLSRIPIVKAIFGTTKQLGEVLLGDRRTAFQKVVLIEFPMPGIYSVGFLTADDRAGDFVCVFVCSTPNPATGFPLIVPRARVEQLPLSVEEGIRLVISGGALLSAAQMRAISERVPSLAEPTGVAATPIPDDAGPGAAAAAVPPAAPSPEAP